MNQFEKLLLGDLNVQNYALWVVAFSKGLSGQRAVESEDAGDMSHRTE